VSDPAPAERDTGTTGTGAGADVVAGFLSVALGVAVLGYVRTFPEMPGGQPGPALFPGIIGALFVLFGAVLAARALLTRRAAGAREVRVGSPRSRMNAAMVLTAIVLYIPLVETLGFLVTMASLLFVLTWRLGAKPWVAAFAAAATAGVILLLFQRLLLVPLPTGLLG
jgi:putative tricarboxylic transport membrane protein